MAIDEVEHIETHREGDWIYGVTIRPGYKDVSWMKLTPEAYEEKFSWYVERPETTFARLGFVVTPEKAFDIKNLFDDHWLDFLYWFQGAASNQAESDELVNYLTGPVAEYAKANGLHIIAARKRIPFHRFFPATSKFSGSAKKKTIIALLEGVDFDKAIADNTVAAFDFQALFELIIAANGGMFEKCKANEKLDNWFVGQAMKATGGKASAQDALVAFRKIKETL